MTVAPDGTEDTEGMDAHYFPAPFRFCLSCGISYAMALRSDFTKLGSLGFEGRSSATTILSLSAISGLKEAEGLEDKARKILSFTDNRQDASLQAGLSHDELTPAVFNVLGLLFE